MQKITHIRRQVCNELNHTYGALLVFILILFSQASLAAGPGPYIYSADGSIVTDTATGLVWRRCSEGLAWNGQTCTGNAIYYSALGALARATTQTGWRVPNLKELSSIVDTTTSYPAINSVAFPDLPSRNGLSFVTSTTESAALFYHVNFSDGSVNSSLMQSIHNSGYLRLVR